MINRLLQGKIEMQRLAAEAIGAFALVFAGTGAVTINNVSGGTVTHVGIALTFGLVVMSMIYALGDVSGAHLNPAVTLGFWIARRFDGRLVAPYLGSQLAGALIASLCLRLLFPDDATLGTTLPAGPWLQSFVLEIILTALLMFVILCVSTGAQEKGIMAGIAVGGLIALEALFAGPICGASMNPARSFAPAVVSGHLEFLWIYLLAPTLGAALGVAGWCCVRPERAHAGNDTAGKAGKSDPQRVLFVCVENSNRSQMAEAFARLYGGKGVEAHSAGSRPSGRVNPKAIEAMREIGCDLAAHRSKSLDDLPQVEFDVVVTMGCGDACPNIPARRREDWQIPDPREMTPGEFRKVRDLIGEKVRRLLTEL